MMKTYLPLLESGFHEPTRKQHNCNNKDQVAQAARLWAGQPAFDPGCRRDRDFSSFLRVQTGPGVHSTSYKMRLKL